MVHAATAGGLSESRLARLREVMAAHVERRTVPGLVAVVGRRGEVHVETLGTNDPGGSTPIARMTPRAWESPEPPLVCRDFWRLAARAIDD